MATAITLETFRDTLLGRCIVQPLRRAGNDFISSGGEALVRAAIQQILHTRLGELPWRPSFGINLEEYRHQNLTDAMASALASDIVEALTEYEPRLDIVACRVDQKENRIRVVVQWQISTEALSGNSTLLGPIKQEVTV